MINYCEGCLTHIFIEDNMDIEKISECSFADYNLNGECPCNLCIVKMMCIDVCDIFLTFEAEVKRND